MEIAPLCFQDIIIEEKARYQMTESSGKKKISTCRVPFSGFSEANVFIREKASVDF